MTEQCDDEIRRLLKHNPPPAHKKDLEDHAVEKALAAFDKKNARGHQGTGFGRRLMGAVRAAINPINGDGMKTSYKLAGGLCAATLAIALITTTSLTQSGFGPITKQEAPAKLDATGVGFSGGVVAQSPVAAPAAIDGAVAPEEKRAEAEGLARSRGDFAPLLSVAKDKSAVTESDTSVAASPAMPTGALAKSSMNVFGGKVVANAMVMPGHRDEGRDKFQSVEENPLKLVKEAPVSTFSVDVDTASYAFMRASLNNNVLPQKDAVRIEELVNYFPYDYAKPTDTAQPFKASVSVVPTPWNTRTKLVHIGIKGYQLEQKAKPRSNLVFLLDTSGSMNEPNKLPLLKNSMKLLLDSLSAEDTVAIVTYAGSAGTVLAPTKASDKAKIMAALENLYSGGSTAGAEGIRQAYALAKQNYDSKGVNRVILATDGDFNVGITNPEELKSYIERERDSGIFLSVLGFGQGNYNDALMQTLAQNGNGNAAYIDSLSEARKVLVEEAGSTLFTIAKDVKLQVEFNPATVAEYRLIGYETRMLKREDFNNDKVDAGDIGAGHTVTAIYEITPAGSDAKLVDDLRYAGKADAPAKASAGGSEYAFLKIRYKLPKESVSKLITTPIDASVEVGTVDTAPVETRFALAVTAFGQLLRGDAHTTSFSYDDVIALAQSSKGADNFGYRAEFINLVRLAKGAAGLKPLDGGQHGGSEPLLPQHR
jgi:Ca-activated chloride channel family protein